MGSERGLWRTLRANLSPYGRLVRIESETEAGISDVAYCINGHAGWLELKEIAGWPKRSSTKVRVPSLTLDQVIFLERWVAAGGDAYLLLQVDSTYLLLTATAARALWNGVPRAELENLALVEGTHHLPTLALVRALTKVEAER